MLQVASRSFQNINCEICGKPIRTHEGIREAILHCQDPAIRPGLVQALVGPWKNRDIAVLSRICSRRAARMTRTSDWRIALRARANANDASVGDGGQWRGGAGHPAAAHARGGWGSSFRPRPPPPPTGAAAPRGCVRAAQLRCGATPVGVGSPGQHPMAAAGASRLCVPVPTQRAAGRRPPVSCWERPPYVNRCAIKPRYRCFATGQQGSGRVLVGSLGPDSARWLLGCLHEF